MSYQEWQYQTSRGISATLALGPGRALILADLPDSFMTIIILAGSTDGLTRDLLEELADSFDLSKLTPIVLRNLSTFHHLNFSFQNMQETFYHAPNFETFGHRRKYCSPYNTKFMQQHTEHAGSR